MGSLGQIRLNADRNIHRHKAGRTVGAVPTVTRTYAFVTECFGTVATVVSRPNELSDEFTATSEIRRLAP